jgi:thiamine phosphate synthase YjbQ (UPF0047 family)
MSATVSNEIHVCTDVLSALGKLVPKGGWLHGRIDSNRVAHIKAGIIGPGAVAPILARELNSVPGRVSCSQNPTGYRPSGDSYYPK